jgi:hypothetical protein
VTFGAASRISTIRRGVQQTCSTRTRDSDSSPTRVQFFRDSDLDSDSRVGDSDLDSDSRVEDSDSGHPDSDSRGFFFDDLRVTFCLLDLYILLRSTCTRNLALP